MNNTPPSEGGPRYPVFALLLFILSLTVFGAVGYWWVSTHEIELAQRRLSVLADLKQQEILDWQKNLERTALLLTRKSLLAYYLEEWDRTGRLSQQSEANVKGRLEAFKDLLALEAIRLYDQQGRMLPQVGQGATAHEPPVDIQSVLQDQKIRVTAPHFTPQAANEASSAVEIEVLAPLLLEKDGKAVVVGGLSYAIDLRRELFALLQNWPDTYQTLEASLLQRDGDAALVLNELRLQGDTALKLQLPLTEGTAAARAVLGEQGSFMARDYRGIQVLAHARPLPGTEWILLVEQDFDEVQQPIMRLRWQVALLTLALTLLFAGFLWLRYLRLRSHFALQQLQVELQAAQVQTRFATLLRQARDIILLLDDKGILIDANQQAFAQYGYQAQEMLGKNVCDVMITDATDFSVLYQQFFANRQNPLRETQHRRADGSLFPVEVSCRRFEFGDQVYYQAIIRDISERKAAEIRHQRLQDFYAFLSQTNRATFRAADETGLFQEICHIAVAYGHINLAFVMQPDAGSGLMQTLAGAGQGLGYLQHLVVSIDPAHPQGQGIVGRCYRSGCLELCQDVRSDERMLPWRASWLEQGFASGVILPLRQNGQTVATLGLYAADVQYWDEDLMALLELVVSDIAFALDTLANERQRRRAEAALREHEQRFRLAFNQQFQSMAILTADGRVLEANDEGCRYCNAAIEHLRGLLLWETPAWRELPEPFADFWPQQLARASASRGAITGLSMLRRPDGSLGYAETATTAIHDEAGVLQGFICQSADVTERHHQEQALGASERRFRLAFNQDFQFMSLLSPTGTILEVNDKTCLKIGQARAYFLGKPIWEVTTVPDVIELRQAIWQSRLQQAVDGGSVTYIENYRFEDGTLIQFEGTLTTIRDEEGQASGMLLQSVDITERLRAERALRDSEQKFRTIVNDMSEGIWGVDKNFVTLFVNPAICQILGYSETELLGRPVEDFVWADQAELLRFEQEKAQRALGHPGHYELRWRRADGSMCWSRISATPHFDAEGQFAGAFGLLHDIGEQKQTEERLRLWASVFANTQEGITITNPDGFILDVNQAFSKTTGYSREEAIGRNPRILKSGQHDAEFYASLWTSLSQFGNWHGEIWNRRKNGEIYPEWLNISAVLDVAGEVSHYIAVFTDISQIKKHERELEYLAYFDPMTGVPNRTLLSDRMRLAIARSRRENTLFALGYLDLDSFKPVNDQLGHAVGDRYLVEIAQRIKSVLRDDDTIARLGGDEFVVLVQGLQKPEECYSTFERLLAKVAEPMEMDRHRLLTTASIGITLFPMDDADADTLLRHADHAMYQAKEAGKNRYQIYDPIIEAEARNHRELIERIERALKRQEFVLHYQPKVDLHSGQVMGVEALIRWQDPERGLMQPGSFLPVIQDHPISKQIDQWVLGEAIQQMMQWRSLNIDVGISVNISGQTLQASDFINNLASLLQKYPTLDPACLEIEVLETVALDDITYVSEIIAQVQRLGIHFALDDFGTGYSSLRYLKHLRAEVLKIDQSFVRDMLKDDEDLAIVEGVIGLSRAFNRKVVAEGVESQAHCLRLIELGCDLVQGYGIAKPMSAAHLVAWIKKWTPPAEWRRLKGF